MEAKCSTQTHESQQNDQENDRDRIIAELTRANSVLKANISTLYRTARAEIARKNYRIEELQAKLDGGQEKEVGSNKANMSALQ